MKDATILAAIAMICLMIIVCFALAHGIDHFVLALGVTVIAGLGGYELKKRREKP